MSKPTTSAVALSDEIARRLKLKHGESSVVGAEIEPLGRGAWRETGFMPPIHDFLKGDADAIVAALLGEYDLDE